MERTLSVTLPELGMISGTRALGGAGLALLLADHLARSQRRAVGWVLLGLGVVSTIPLIASVVLRRRAELGHRVRSALEREAEAAAH
jgi:hypothetical protein